MRRSIEEQAEYMLEKMTVDMSIDFWQTKELVSLSLTT